MKKMLRFIARAFLVPLAATLAALASTAHAQWGNSEYGGRDARQQQAVVSGVVLDVSPASISAPASPEAKFALGALGGALCASVASKSNANWMVLGALTTSCGAGAAMVADKIASAKVTAFNLVVRTVDGNVISVVQSGDMSEWQRGLSVYVLKGTETRVIKA
jgi:outer membrane lipoprotein SlyB